MTYRVRTPDGSTVYEHADLSRALRACREHQGAAECVSESGARLGYNQAWERKHNPRKPPADLRPTAPIVPKPRPRADRARPPAPPREPKAPKAPREPKPYVSKAKPPPEPRPCARSGCHHLCRPDHRAKYCSRSCGQAIYRQAPEYVAREKARLLARAEAKPTKRPRVDTCQAPGCGKPLPEGHHPRVRYCSDPCRLEEIRLRDRQRKERVRHSRPRAPGAATRLADAARVLIDALPPSEGQPWAEPLAALVAILPSKPP